MKHYFIIIILLFSIENSYGQFGRWLSRAEKKWSCDNIVGTFKKQMNIKLISNCFKMISMEEYPKYTHKATGAVINDRADVKYGYKLVFENPNTYKIKLKGTYKLFDKDDFNIDDTEFDGFIDANGTKTIQGYGYIDYDSELDRVEYSATGIAVEKYK